MKVEKRADNYIVPVNNEDEALFSHCADGMIAVTQVKFDNVVAPLLMMHGVMCIEMSGLDDIDNT